MKDKIGLVGLGLVGTAIAERLLSDDFDVIGFDAEKSAKIPKAYIIPGIKYQSTKKCGG